MALRGIDDRAPMLKLFSCEYVSSPSIASCGATFVLETALWHAWKFDPIVCCTACGVLNTRSMSGSLRFSTTSASLHAARPSASTADATLMACLIFVGPPVWGAAAYRRVAGTRLGRTRLKPRLQAERERPQLRIVVRCHGAEGAGVRDTARDSNLGVPPLVRVPRVQIPTDERDAPVTHAPHRSDLECDTHLAELGVGSAF